MFSFLLVHLRILWPFLGFVMAHRILRVPLDQYHVLEVIWMLAMAGWAANSIASRLHKTRHLYEHQWVQLCRRPSYCLVGRLPGDFERVCVVGVAKRPDRMDASGAHVERLGMKIRGATIFPIRIEPSTFIINANLESYKSDYREEITMILEDWAKSIGKSLITLP